jgi:hypothetical protein
MAWHFQRRFVAPELQLGGSDRALSTAEGELCPGELRLDSARRQPADDDHRAVGVLDHPLGTLPTRTPRAPRQPTRPMTIRSTPPVPAPDRRSRCRAFRAGSSALPSPLVLCQASQIVQVGSPFCPQFLLHTFHVLWDDVGTLQVGDAFGEERPLLADPLVSYVVCATPTMRMAGDK